METVSVETISETGVSNDCQTIPELSDKQKKKSRKKKRKSRKQENKLDNDDSHITSQNGNADEVFSSEKKKEGETEKSTDKDQVQLSESRLSTLPAESCQRDSISCEEPGATLHHTDPIFSTGEDSLPDASKNGSSRKRTLRKGKKKKEGASCEEKMLDDAKKTTNEDQVHPPNNPLSNGIIQEVSRKHTEDSCEKPGAAQLCTDPSLSTQEDSQPDATNLTSSQRRKRKRERDTNALKESGVDFCTTAEVAAKYNTISEAEGSKLMSKEEISVAGVVINSSLKSKDDTVEQRECTGVKLHETVAQTQSPKAKIRKKRKTKTMEICDPLGNTLAPSIKSGSVECVETNDGNAGRELMSNLASQRENSATREESGIHNLEKTKETETDDNTEVKEDLLELEHNTISEGEGSKSVSVEEKSVANVVMDSCLKSIDDTVKQGECTDVKLSETVAQTQSPKAKKRKKRKTKTVEVCDPLGNTLATSTKSGPVECVENNAGNGNRELMSNLASQREKSATGEEYSFHNLEKTEEKETYDNTEVKEDVREAKHNTISEAEGSKSMSKEEISVASVVIDNCLKSKDDTVEQREGTDVKLNETQSPKAKKRKKRETKTVEVCDPLGTTLATSTESGPVECVENNAGNGNRELMSNLASQREKSATGEESSFHNLEKTKEKETDDNTEVEEDVRELKHNTISEAEGSKSMSKEEKSVASVVIDNCLKSKDDTVEQREGTDVKLNETRSPKAKKRKKRKTNSVEVCDPLGNTLATSTKSGPVECVENNAGNGDRELMSILASQREKTATGEESGFHNLEKTEEKETDDSTEFKEDVREVKHNTISEAEGSKSMSKEEKSVASVVIDNCLKSKDDTVEQREGTDVKLNETRSPKAKKRKKRKTNSVEVCDPLGNTLATSTKSRPVECVENNAGNGDRELMSILASQREKTATGEESGFHNLEKTEEKETDDSTEFKEDVREVKHNTISEAEGSKSMSKEEKSVASVVIDNCLKSKDDTVEQREGTDVKLNETQSSTAKKRKKRKTKTVEVCDPLENTLPTSTKSGPVECVENNDGNAGREIISYSASPGEKSATGEESGFQNLENIKEKETDENTEVEEDVLRAGTCDVRSKKRKGRKKKTSSADHKTADMKVCDPTRSVECLLDHSNIDDKQNSDGNAGQEFGGEDMTIQIEKSATKEKSGVQKSGKRKEMTKDENIESNQDALGAEGVSDVGCKRQKTKSNKKTNCESVAIMDSESVQCLLYHINRDGLEICDGNAYGEIASKDLASKSEDSATKGESVEDVEIANKNKNDKKGEVDQDALGAEVVSKVDVKTKKSKKKKNSLDSNIDNMEEKVDVSLPRNDEEPEFDREKPETSLSLPNSVLIQNIVAREVASYVVQKKKEVASSESGDVPRCSCEGQRIRKLVIFDLNGILADIVQGFTGQFVPDGKISYRSVFRRPFVSSFLDFCFERFEVAIWSSRRIGLDYMINIVMENYARNLLFCFDQNLCTTTEFKTQEKNDKPLFLKDLRRVWDRFGTCISCGKRKYDETNTLLIDDSPDKALCNPPHTGIFPWPYQYTDRKDSALGHKGELRKYLERLADAENIQKFVAENPFGQTAITETHESWEFYSKVIEAHK